MMRTRIGVLTVLSLIAVQAVAWADIVTGTVESVNTADNEITLKNVQVKTEENGQTKTDTKDSVTITWKDDLPGLQTLENAKPGTQLTVDVKRSVGKWEVQRVLTDQSGSQSANQSSSRQSDQSRGSTSSTRKSGGVLNRTA